MRWQPTVAGWQNLVLSIMGVLVLGGAIAGALLLNRTDDVSRDLIDDIQPARVLAYQLQGALLDQETAVRGYALTADPVFLPPYFAGQKAEQAAAQEIRLRVGTRSELVDDLDSIQAAAVQWRESFAEPLIADVSADSSPVVEAATVERGKVQFGVLRKLFDTQNDHLSQVREEGIGQLNEIRTWRDGVLCGMVVTFFVAAVLLALVVRNAVTRPLDALAQKCRNITEGNFAEKIVPRGPKDIRAIASDVEDMRQRIVDELEASRSARSQLADQALDLQRSNAELEQFAYVASHDLQEPLRKVASFCQLLEKRYGDKLDERGAEYIGFAVDGAKRMQVLINDLLTFSRVGRLNSTDTEVDLGATLDDAVANLATAIEESGTQVEQRGEPLPRISGDPTLLTMLWQNLIGNAVKFRRDGVAPRIVIDCEKGVHDRTGTWLFTVSDNGIGIPDEFSDKVFVIFQRLHGRDAYSGTGIGLALCKKIVEHHGGSIWIDTSYTAGTRFRFTIPIAADANVPANLEGTPA
jgi:signal transduction histidine kinase